MNVFSTFTGVAGIDLGLERAGMRIVAQCEKDAWCRRRLAELYPGIPCYEDIREVSSRSVGERLGQVDRDRAVADPERQRVPLAGQDACAGVGVSCHEAIGDVGADAWGRHGRGDESVRCERDRPTREATERPVLDLLCGGFPCQDVSVAGKRAGLDGDRSGLFFEFARVADELVRPGGWLLVENVPGLLSSAQGRDFAVVLATLADIGFHDLAWRVLDSRYFGVPQRRRRVFIVARRAAGDRARQVLLEPESGGGDFAPSREAGTRVAASLASGSHGPGISAPGRRQHDDEDIVAGPLAGGGKRGYRVGAEEAAGGHLVAGAIVKRYGKGTDSDATDTLITHTLRAEGFDAGEDGTGRGTPLTVSPLVSRSSRGRPQTLSPGHNTDDHLVIAGTVRTHVRPGSNSSTDIVCAAPDADGVRATPIVPGWLDDPRPDGPRYSAMGNAVTVNVIEWIGHRIMSAEAEVQRRASDAA